LRVRIISLWVLVALFLLAAQANDLTESTRLQSNTSKLLNPIPSRVGILNFEKLFTGQHFWEMLLPLFIYSVFG